MLTGAAPRAWITSDDVDVVVHGLDESALGTVVPASDYDQGALRAAVTSDRDLLRSLLDDVSAIDRLLDAKVAALADELAEISTRARVEGLDEEDVRNRRKILVFTYYADTTRYLADAVEALTREDPRLADYAGRVALAAGWDRETRTRAVLGFAPRTAVPDSHEKNRFDLIIATDVLSKGVNLQQAGQIVNYDLPWNPMRLMQRHSRIDRSDPPTHASTSGTSSPTTSWRAPGPRGPAADEARTGGGRLRHRRGAARGRRHLTGAHRGTGRHPADPT